MNLKRLSVICEKFVRRYGTKSSYSTATISILLKNETESIITDCYPKPYSEVPGPKQLPLIGNSWRFAPIIGHYKIQELDKVMWSLYKEYGKIVRVGGLIGHPDLLFVFDGDEIQRIFKREEHMPHRPSMPSLHYYKEHFRKDFFHGNEGVIGIHGTKWDSFRKQVQQVMLSPVTAKKYIEPLDVIASEFIDRMEESLDKNRELPECFLFEIYKWALESVARVALDTRLGCLKPNLSKYSESQKIIDSINTFFWNVAEVELKMPIWRVYKNKAFRKYIGALEDFRTLCMKHITKVTETMSQMEFSTRDEQDIPIVKRILNKTKNNKIAAVLALDLLLVGVDTTSIAVASTLYQLSQNQEKQQKLFEELRTILPTKESKIDATVQERLDYLKACIKETLSTIPNDPAFKKRFSPIRCARMYPVIIGNGRSLTSDAVIGGYKVPKGTHVIFPHLVVSNLTEYFENPETFEPERWLKSKESEGNCLRSEKNHPFVSLPFGYGRRSCLGRRFANIELQILLAKIFRKYKVEYHHEPLTYKITPTYVPEQPLRFRLIKRNV